MTKDFERIAKWVETNTTNGKYDQIRRSKRTSIPTSFYIDVSSKEQKYKKEEVEDEEEERMKRRRTRKPSLKRKVLQDSDDEMMMILTPMKRKAFVQGREG